MEYPISIIVYFNFRLFIVGVPILNFALEVMDKQLRCEVDRWTLLNVFQGVIRATSTSVLGSKNSRVNNFKSSFDISIHRKWTGTCAPQTREKYLVFLMRISMIFSGRDTLSSLNCWVSKKLQIFCILPFTYCHIILPNVFRFQCQGRNIVRKIGDHCSNQFWFYCQCQN